MSATRSSTPGCAVPDRQAPIGPAATGAGPPGLALSICNLRTVIRTEGVDHEVVRGLSLDIQPDEIVCLVGESGCGKTMTALSALRLVPSPPARVVGGEVMLAGRDLLKLSNREMRAVRTEEISMIFQDPLTSLDPVFTVGQMLIEVICTHRPLSKRDATDLAISALGGVGLPAPHQQIDAYPHQLSGGMRQRVMIAMALMLDPSVLIADEPTTALDVTVQAQILDRLLEEQRKRHMAMLLITHDLAIVASIADRVAVMYSGEIVELAPVRELFSNPRHPYTQGLLKALPSARSKGVLYSIPGRVPPPQFPPPGCHFAPRCPYAVSRCWQQYPELTGEGLHQMRCFNPQPFDPS